MARLDELLARGLLRCLKRKDGKGISPALEAYCESQELRLARLRTKVRRLAEAHDKLKARHRKLKEKQHMHKAAAVMKEREAYQWQNHFQAQKERVLTLEHSMGAVLERPGLAPLLPVQEQRKSYLKNRWSVWKYPMRLGVLRQHEPKPFIGERFPELTLPQSVQDWPLVSIVTPSFQQGAFLERTIASVLNQRYPRLEYRVCDGGSTDSSLSVLKQYEARLTSWSSERDSGPASAVNRGFSQSQGEIMAWLNSDDLLMPGVLHFVADYFHHHPEVDVLYGHRVVIDDRDWEVGRWVLPRHDGEMLLWADFVPQETLFWRRELWEKVGGGLDESYQFAFDWELLLRFQKAGAHMVRLPRFMGCFRVHDAQKSTTEINTVGIAEMTRLREREMGPGFKVDKLDRRVVAFQRRAIWCDRLRRLGVRW
jgi:glycosyltransferase involved in cell wall biosynthesis